jgi:Zn-dependent alcohol dehydrogenase
MDGTTRLSQNGAPVYHFSGLACFAEHAVVPQESCVPIPHAVPAPVTAVLGCAVTTGVGAALNTMPVQPGDNVVVFGAGGVGLSTIMGAKLAGAGQIIAVDVSAEKSAMAHYFGATHALTTDEDVLGRIRDLTEGRGADIVFEAIGIPAVQEQCLAAVRPGGTLVLVGLSPMGSATNFPSAIIARQEKTIVGSYYGSADTSRDFPRYAQWYRDGKLDLDRLITRTYTLDQINDAYADMLAGIVARGVIVLA